MKVKAVILAGGEGSRLRPLTYYFQKCMIPIGPSQKPVLEYILLHVKAHKITKDIILLVGYKAEQIVNYFKNGRNLGFNITYIHDSDKYKGTGGSLINAYRQGAVTENDTLLVYYGDIISNINLEDMLTQHLKDNADVTLAVSRRYQIPVGVVKIEGNRIYGIEEKPFMDIPVSIGIMFINGNLLNRIAELHKTQSMEKLDIMADILPRFIQQGFKIQAYTTEAFWYDVGSTERYEKLTSELVQKHMGFLESIADY
ncbi:MAG TPA: nucleotidyltransferase family protein [Candidatus Caldiarchaeum subterraneum]|uniref:Nucleotidyltransferase family protein n=1 Tax=Caldiarchaeum subterraneum TaxID=311458 RepID=A0A833A4B0_CALS0|nr:nucleotidyltransferase family protein [Candidatus Caldarchaeum subterraneum]